MECCSDLFILNLVEQTYLFELIYFWIYWSFPNWKSNNVTKFHSDTLPTAMLTPAIIMLPPAMLPTRCKQRIAHDLKRRDGKEKQIIYYNQKRKIRSDCVPYKMY